MQMIWGLRVSMQKRTNEIRIQLISHKVICSSPTGKYPEQHIFKRAISMKLQEIVLTDFFLDDENNFPIDVNVIQIHPNGSKKTLLDYLNYEIDTALSR